MDSLYAIAERCLQAVEPEEKVRLTAEAAAGWRSGQLALAEAQPPVPIGDPGRPDRPRLVPPRALPARGLGSTEGHAAFVHAVAHIEFNAINLAWDAVYRFRGLPSGYYGDWIAVAAEEARHFQAVSEHLGRLGWAYGDFDAHDGLWEMARRTAADPLERMALVPRVLEARGLDVTPGMRARLEALGDHLGAGVLSYILREEVGHVGRGSHWFRELCAQRGLAQLPTFRTLLARHFKGGVRGPLNLQARREAGFSDEELEWLATLTSGPRTADDTRLTQ